MSRVAAIAARLGQRRYRYGMEAGAARALELEVPDGVPDSAQLYDAAKAPTTDPEGRVIVSTPGPLCSCWVWFAANHAPEAA